MSDELVPVVLVDDLTHWPNKASGIRRYFANVNTGAVTNIPYLSVFNPIGSRVFVVVEGITSVGPLAIRWVRKFPGPQAGTAIVNFAYVLIDAGIVSGATAPGKAVFNRDDSAGAQGDTSALGVFMGAGAGAVTGELPLGIVCGENEGVDISPAVTGTALSAIFHITEYDIQP
jgi:hypothetical protein